MWNFNCFFSQLSLALLHSRWATTTEHRKFFRLIAIGLELSCLALLIPVPSPLICFVLPTKTPPCFDTIITHTLRRRSPHSGYMPISYCPRSFILWLVIKGSMMVLSFKRDKVTIPSFGDYLESRKEPASFFREGSKSRGGSKFISLPAGTSVIDRASGSNRLAQRWHIS